MKSQRNSAYKPLWATFLMVAMVIIIGISCVSAADLAIDNYKDVSEDNTTITYYDKGQIGEDTLLAEFELKSNHIEEVGVGYVKVFEYELTNSFEDVSKMIGSTDCYNVNINMKPIECKIDLKYKEVYNVIIQNDNCNDPFAPKPICNPFNTTQQDIRWIDYDPKTTIKGETITISGWTTTQEGDKVEWIPTFYDDNLRIEEWAEWDAGLEVGLRSWYKMDEGSGAVADSLENFSGTNNGATQGGEGILGDGYNFSEDDYWVTDAVIGVLDDYSVSIWVKPAQWGGVHELDTIWDLGYDATNSAMFFHQTSTGHFSVFHNGTQNQFTGITAPVGTWNHMVYVREGTVGRLYINGTSMSNITVSTTALASLKFAAGWAPTRAGAGFGINAHMDEAGLWSRVLTGDEVVQLYNGGIGITCFPNIAPTITANATSPATVYPNTNWLVNLTITDPEGGTLTDYVQYYVNGTANGVEQLQVVTNNTNTQIGTLDSGEFSAGDNLTAQVWAGDGSKNSTKVNLTVVTVQPLEVPIITLLTPIDNYNSALTTVAFSCNVTDNDAVVNTSLLVDSATVSTNTSAVNGTYNFTDTGLAQGSHNWTCEGCDGVEGCNTAGVRTFNVDSIDPTIVINSGDGTEDYSAITTNHTINFTVTDTHLDTCILEYNGANTTITGCLTGVYNTTNFTMTQGVYNATIYANDTFGNMLVEFLDWDYRILELNDTFVTPVLEGTTNKFLINVSTNSSIATGYLYYDGTAYIGSVSSSGDVYTIQRNHVAKELSAAENVSFYWNVTTADGYNYNFTAQNQTVNPIVINSTCTGMYVIYNFTLVDELTQLRIIGALNDTLVKTDLHLYSSDRATEFLHYYTEFSGVNSSAICIDSNLSDGSVYSLDLQVEYDADAYANEMYNIENYTLNESSMNQSVNLYDLPDASAQDFKLLARDNTYLPLAGILIEVHRKYIENGTFQIVEIPKTDGDGIATASLQLNDVIYNFYLYQDGVLTASFTNVNAICQTPSISTCEIDFNAFSSGVDVYDYEEGDDLDFTLGYNQTSRVVSSVFTIPSGSPGTIKLTVIKEDALGTAVCTDTLTSASGTLSCTVPNSFGNSTVLAYIYKDDVEQGKGNLKLDEDSSDIYGGSLIFLSFMVFITLLGIGMSDNPIVTVVFLMVGVMIMMAMNLIQNTGFIGATATFLFLAIAGVLILIKAARRN